MSMSSVDATDAVVRMMVSGAEVTLRLTASATKNLMAISIALAKSHKKLYGRTNLKKMLRETRDIRVFSMERQQFRAFQKQARKLGLLYASIRDKGPEGAMVEVLLPTTELDRANAVFEKIRYVGTRQASREPEQTTERKNGSRSGPGWRDTKPKAVSRDGPSPGTNEPVSVEARLETYRVQLTQKRVPAKQRRKMQQKKMDHKRNQVQRP